MTEPASTKPPGAEQRRLDESNEVARASTKGVAAAPWRQWGPFVSNREWGTVREDYSADGEAWRSVTHDEARSTAYRWGEDGLAAICDRRQGICLGLALWNGNDPILKERLFGLTGKEGNHGEDVKECYWHVDATPTHSWLSWRYHYPQAEFPYADLVDENARRSYEDPEYELLDTGIFEDGYWVIEVDYAKASATDICMRIRATNRGPQRATLHLLPTLWMRNVWTWNEASARPELRGHAHADGHAIVTDHHRLGRWIAAASAEESDGELLFCENESNIDRLYGTPGLTPFPKDGINDHVVSGGAGATVNPEHTGTKAAWWFRREADAGETIEIRVRFTRLGEEPTLDPVRLLIDTTFDPPRPPAPQLAAQSSAQSSGQPSAQSSGHSSAQPADWSGSVESISRLVAPLDPFGAADALDHALDLVPVTDDDLPDLGADFLEVMTVRSQEADAFYRDLVVASTSPPTAGAMSSADAGGSPVAVGGEASTHLIPPDISTKPSSPPTKDEALILRRAYAGLLWSQQFYRFNVADWLDGDPGSVAPPPNRGDIRNGHWRHLDANDVILMPDNWEYPWFASWDLAFHAVALSRIDPVLAKQQLELLFRVWYQHPNGALPAYEWEFSDANPPVHAWAAIHVYEVDAHLNGGVFDTAFLERIFHKLMLNFTWWVNREDAEGNNIFEGGFLGLDNIGPFNRSEGLPFDGVLEQSDGSGWMAMYCLNLLQIALELAARNDVYEDVAVKFFEHFTLISEAMTKTGLWSEEDGFFFDIVRCPDGSVTPVKIRSMVGLVPLTALTVIHDHQVADLATFLERARWFVTHRPTADSFFGRYMADENRAMGLLSVVSPQRLRRVLETVLDEDQLLSPFGLRSMSRAHLDEPAMVDIAGTHTEVRYEPGESESGLFGGNSNWRGPIWFPLNFLVIEKLRRYYEFLGDDYTVEFPTGSGEQHTLEEVAQALARRLIALFLRDDPTGGGGGRRPINGENERLQTDPEWRDEIWFHEYFHGDTGAGLGASHQTGWTALVANLILTLR